MRGRCRHRSTLALVAIDPGRPRVWAPVLDAVCLGAFVALGRSSHDLHGGVVWFVLVLWPFVVGWYAVALLTRLYRTGTAPLRRAFATAAVGVTAALVLRATLTTRSTPLVFGVIVFVFVTLFTVGWRAVAAGWARRARARARARPDPGQRRVPGAGAAQRAARRSVNARGPSSWSG